METATGPDKSRRKKHVKMKMGTHQGVYGRRDGGMFRVQQSTARPPRESVVRVENRRLHGYNMTTTWNKQEKLFR